MKTMFVTKTEIIKGYTVPVDTLVVNYKRGSQTRMTMSSIEVDTGGNDGDVSIRRLEE